MKNIKIKKCVGVVIYNDEGKIFLMASPKWKKWLVPGGKIEEGETEEEALIREIKEEMNIELEEIFKFGEMFKSPSDDFKDPEITFHFIDFFAKALQTEIVPNEEISEYGWFTIEEAFELDLLDTTRKLINQYQKHVENHSK